MRGIGVGLVVFGLTTLVYGGIGYDRHRTVLDESGNKMTVMEHKTPWVAPTLGAIALLAGGVLLMIPRRLEAP